MDVGSGAGWEEVHHHDWLLGAGCLDRRGTGADAACCGCKAEHGFAEDLILTSIVGIEGSADRKGKPQISPLRYAPVEMTNLWRDEIPRFQERSAELQIPRLRSELVTFLIWPVVCDWK